MCVHCELQAGCENQLEKGEAFQDLPRLDLVENELKNRPGPGHSQRSAFIRQAFELRNATL